MRVRCANIPLWYSNRKDVFDLNTGYVIYACYGEYDDYNEVPMFFCSMEMEAHLYMEALENQEQPYWQKVIDFFRKRAGCEGSTAISDEEIEKYRMPSDLGFGLNKVEVLSLMEKHPAT